MNTSHYKDLLEKELALLEKNLATVGRKNPYQKGDWEATEPQDGEETEEGDLADRLSEYNDNIGAVDQLESRLNNIKDALIRIEEGTYGICETCNEKIEEDRLEANPAATTCKSHMNE